MPRRFALGLVALLVLLLIGLLAGRRILAPSGALKAGVVPTPTARPTPVTPPTPIAGQRVSLWFEPVEGELFRAEERELPAAADEIAFLRALGAAVLDGPRRPELLRPFPEGWSLRGAYRLRDGLVVLDLQPPVPGGGAMMGPPAPETALGPRWQTGSHEELAAVQALLITIAKNVPNVTKVALVVSGEPAETLAGHVDLAHPLVPDMARAGTEPALEAAAAPAPAAVPSPVETETPESATPQTPTPPPAKPKQTRPAGRTDVA